MRTCVLGLPGEKITGYKLGYPMFFNPEHINPEDWDVLIRWGNSNPIYYGDVEGEEDDGEARFKLILNDETAIAENCDKLASLEALSEVVATPTIYQHVVPKGVRSVVRPGVHKRGEGFELVTGPLRIPPGHYALKFVDTPKEFRVWYCCGATMAAKRVYNAEVVPPTDHPACRSNWAYSYLDQVPKVMHRETVAAFEHAGLDLGAADILWKEDEKKYYFLELNTAPTLDTGRLVEFFRKGIQTKINEVGELELGRAVEAARRTH